MSLPSTPPAPPVLNADDAETVVAVVEKLISLPFRNLVKVLEAEEEGTDPLYMDDAAEVGALPWFRHVGTVVAVLRELCMLDAGDRSVHRSLSPLRMVGAGDADGPPQRAFEAGCRPRHDESEAFDEEDCMAPEVRGGGVKAMADDAVEMEEDV